MGAGEDVVISTDLKLRLDGIPYSGQPEPKDPGVAVYWRVRKEVRCMAVDRYDRIADNIAAIAATLEAMRAIERHGGAEVLDRAFSGFAALPAPAQNRWWWEVLGVDRASTRQAVGDAYKRMRSSAHPDNGGTPEAFAEVTVAWEDYQHSVSGSTR